MNKEEAKARIEAAEKELAAAKAALEQAQEPDGRVIMKPSEVPVGEYFRYLDGDVAGGHTCYKVSKSHYSRKGTNHTLVVPVSRHSPVYLTDPYGNAIEPCEEFPDWLNPGDMIAAIDNPAELLAAFNWISTKEGNDYWLAQSRLKELTPDAAAKLRGMIHKWNQENGGQG